MKDRKLATRYARALLAALPEAAAQNRADAFLTTLARSVSEVRELRDFLHNPAVASAAKTTALRAIADGSGAGSAITNFLATIVAHGRVANLASIAEIFHQERERSQGVVTATLTAATAVPADLQARAAAALEKLSGRKVNLEVDVDPRLLGGASVRIGSTVYDGSIRTQLDRLRTRLAEE